MMSKLLLDAEFISTLTKRLSIMIEADEKVAQGDNRKDISKLKDHDIEKEGCLRGALYQVVLYVKFITTESTQRLNEANFMASFCTRCKSEFKYLCYRFLTQEDLDRNVQERFFLEYRISSIQTSSNCKSTVKCKIPRQAF